MPEAENPKADRSLVMSFKIHKRKRGGRTVLRDGEKSGEQTDVPSDTPSGRIPRISRLMALAIHIQNLVDQGVVQDYAEIARLTGVTRARVTQIMNLNLLAPEIQEEILLLPKTLHGKDLIVERNVRNTTKNIDWIKQKRKWNTITAECNL